VPPFPWTPNPFHERAREELRLIGRQFKNLSVPQALRLFALANCFREALHHSIILLANRGHEASWNAIRYEIDVALGVRSLAPISIRSTNVNGPSVLALAARACSTVASASKRFMRAEENNTVLESDDIRMNLSCLIPHHHTSNSQRDRISCHPKVIAFPLYFQTVRPASETTARLAKRVCIQSGYTTSRPQMNATANAAGIKRETGMGWPPQASRETSHRRHGMGHPKSTARRRSTNQCRGGPSNVSAACEGGIQTTGAGECSAEYCSGRAESLLYLRPPTGPPTAASYASVPAGIDPVASAPLAIVESAVAATSPKPNVAASWLTRPPSAPAATAPTRIADGRLARARGRLAPPAMAASMELRRERAPQGQG
jgi:hypothetical protein